MEATIRVMAGRAIMDIKTRQQTPGHPVRRYPPKGGVATELKTDMKKTTPERIHIQFI
tara:strand:- start:470 stop:643 length:174 start_codon:yes stop_codon:yes gene_type:complete